MASATFAAAPLRWSKRQGAELPDIGYKNLARLAEVDGAWLRFCFDCARTQTVAGIKVIAYDATPVTHVHGLGHSMAEIPVHSIGMDTRLWALATLIDGEIVELTVVSRIQRIREPRRPIVGMPFLPGRKPG